MNFKRKIYIAKFLFLRKIGALKEVTPASGEIKQNTIRTCAREVGADILVESGTYRGATIDALKNDFKKIYSIELGADLCAAAQKKFAPFPHIKILCGDSAIVLPQLLQSITSPATFWLDAHFSGGDTVEGTEVTPIIKELSMILAHPYPSAIVIDDARLFNGIDYPTLQTLRRHVQKLAPRAVMSVENDLITIRKNDQG